MIPILQRTNPTEYNSHGYRCDDFTLPSDLPIIFLGCSWTEGYGLALNDVWSYKLIQKIRNITNKNIPYWSLAVGGTGLDTQTRLLYEFSKLHSLEYIFCLFPPNGFRREYCFNTDTPKVWLGDVERSDEGKLLGQMFANKQFANYQDQRSLMLIDSIRKQNHSRVVVSFWPSFTCDPAIREQFPDIKFTEIGSGIIESLRIEDFASDGQHPGPKFHTSFSEYFWSETRHLF